MPLRPSVLHSSFPFPTTVYELNGSPELMSREQAGLRVPALLAAYVHFLAGEERAQPVDPALVRVTQSDTEAQGFRVSESAGVSQGSEHQTPAGGQALRKCYPIQGILPLWTHQSCIVLENFISNLNGVSSRRSKEGTSHSSQVCPSGTN